VPAPAVPEGWQVLDAGPVRFAVPPGWAVIDTDLRCTSSQGVRGLVVRPSSTSPCEPPADGAALTLTPASAAAATGERARVGTMPATVIPGACAGCAPDYVLDAGVLVTATGADAEAALATFTDSGAARALEAGPVADTATWRTVAYGAVALQVPPGWGTIDYDHMTVFGTTPEGYQTVSGGGYPGVCGSAAFPADGTPVVSLGVSETLPSCAPSLGWGPETHREGDGVWLRLDGVMGTSEVAAVASGSVGGLHVVAGPSDLLAQSPALEVRATRPGGDAVLVSIGVGLDPSVARAIVRSIRPA
jgi:hypothetical protein